MNGLATPLPPSAFDSEAPARARWRSVAARPPFTSCSTEQLELIARGDFVSGVRVRSPRAAAGDRAIRPLLLLVHDRGASCHAPEWAALVPWVGRGLDLVALDLPLHGPRASAKLSERLADSVATLAQGGALDSGGAVLVEEFRRQALVELARTLDALLAADGYEAKRTGVLAMGLGAWLASDWLAREGRVASAVLVATDRAPVPPDVADPAANGASPRDRGPALLRIRAAGSAADPATWVEAAERQLAAHLAF